MSNVLTKKQEKAVDDLGLMMLKNGIKCGIKTNQAKARKHVAVLYAKHLEIPQPKEIVFVASPEAAIAAVAASTGKTPQSLVSEVQYLNLWTWWVAYYSAGINILKEECEKDLVDDFAEYEQITKDIHAVLPCENVCFVIEYPKAIHIKNNDLDKFVLHREGGLAVEYSDGTGFAWLNNIEVPDYVAVTPVADMPITKLMAETNVDVRREGLRRVGVAAVLKTSNAKTLDMVQSETFWENYRLVECDFGDKKRRFLCMADPAAKTEVVERVADMCNTVAEALAMQCQETKYVRPTKIT